ncbi:olfactory receptor-like protein OLF4 [Genypterus blacodes]|uniref:olfactory receptor-like protein OLF4 n=1 Tax=Genypterus blacodes TaxID=154954 RepID=UPI003F758AB2
MGPDQKAAVIFNATFVRPEKFYIGGFSNVPDVKYYFVFLCFVYIVTVLGNVLLLSVIYQVKTLHTPKYMIVCNLAFTDLCESTALLPKVLDTFLFNRRYIVYEACLSHMFFVYFLASMQSWTLVIMAYDRLIAICFPFRYHSLVTKQSITAMLLFSWVFLSSLVIYIVKLFDGLSFCRSLVIPDFFCEYAGTFHLACNDISLNVIMLFVVSVILLCIPLIFIAVTYVSIAIALIRIASAQERLKAMKTCTSHLILVAIFFLPITGGTIATFVTYLDVNSNMLINCLTLIVPAFLNPIVYSLKTEEVLSSIRKLYQRNK